MVPEEHITKRRVALSEFTAIGLYSCLPNFMSLLGATRHEYIE